MNGAVGVVAALVVVTLQVVSAQGSTSITSNINITDCGSTAQLIEVNLSPCPPYKDNEFGNGCKLQRGTSSALLIRFKPDSNVQQVKREVFGRVLVYVRFRGYSSADACPNIEGGCPLQQGTIYTYTSAVPIQQNYPPMSVPIKYYLKEEGTDKILVCFIMASRII